MASRSLRAAAVAGAFLLLVGFSITSWSATLTEGFEGAFPPAGWLVRNQSTVIGSNAACWTQSTSSPGPAHGGVAHARANFSCTAGDNTISGWLISTPLSNLQNGDQVSFWTRKATAETFPDRLQVRLCVDTTPDSCGTAGSTGALSTDVGSYTVLLVDVNPTLVPGGYPTVYTQFNATVSGVPAGPHTGRLAFRYFVTNGGPNGANSDTIAVDDVAITPPVSAPTLIISEFRVRGPSGANDEYVKIYNNGNLDHTVAAISGTGYGVAASDGIVRCTIPNGTLIRKGGHFLCTNSVAYSLSGNSSGTGDATYTTDIPDNAGIALFNNNTGGGSFTLANRLDAVGSTSEANTLYKEGTGYPALTPFSIDYAFVRDQCGKAGSISSLVPCTTSSPVDTNNNAVDFYFVDTNGTSAGAGQRLGSPGPQNLGSPVSGGNFIATLPLDSTVLLVPPNVVRDFTSDPANNSTFGTVSIRKRFVNNTGAPLTRLRFRVVDQATFPAPSGIADLRTRTSAAVVVAGVTDAATCAATGAPATPPCTVTAQGTTLEQPPSQPNGGAFNGTFNVPTVTGATPLANGASINLQFLFGLQQTGAYHVGMIAEGLPEGGDVFMVVCHTDLPCSPQLQTAATRRVHGGTPFDMPLSLIAPPAINHNPGTEPRQGPAHTVVFTFDRPINAASASVTEGTAAIGVISFSGNSVIVPLTGVTDRQYVTVAVSNVTATDGTSGGSGSARIGFLLGDVSQNRVVTLADVGQVNAQLAQPVSAANFLKDVNVSGTLSLADKVLTNNSLTNSLPTP